MRHKSDASQENQRVCFGQLTELVSGESGGWHTIGREGTWKGHHQGEFSLDNKIFKEIEKWASGSKVEIVVDYDHATVFGDEGGKALAAGWIDDVKVEGKALMGRISWTPIATEHIKNRELRYLSPVFVFHTKDLETGKVGGASLPSVALLNTPFLDLPEAHLNNRRVASEEKLNNDNEERDPMLEQLRIELGLAEDATEDEVMAAVKKMKGAPEEAEAKVQVAEEATAEKEKEVVEEKAKVEAAEQVANSLRADMAVMCANKAVEDAQRKGIVTADLLAWAQKTALDSPDTFKSWALSAKAIVPTGRVDPAPAPTPDTGLSAEELRFCKGIGLTDEQLKRS